jgi:hypothetical protein
MTSCTPPRTASYAKPIDWLPLVQALMAGMMRPLMP